MEDYPFLSAEQLLREELGTRTRIGAQVEAELNRKGPLYGLVLHKREIAAEALSKLIDVHPQNSHEITALQERVKSFVADCDWIRAQLLDGREADAQIKEIWGEEGHDDPGSEAD